MCSGLKKWFKCLFAGLVSVPHEMPRLTAGYTPPIDFSTSKHPLAEF